MYKLYQILYHGLQYQVRSSEYMSAALHLHYRYTVGYDCIMLITWSILFLESLFQKYSSK